MKNQKKSNSFVELIKEAFGGTPFKGGGTFSNASQTGSKTWAHQSSPFRNMTGGPNSSELYGIIQAEEEETHHAPPVKPFPLETIDENLVKAFLQLGNAQIQLKNCLKYNSYINTKPEKKAFLEFLHDKIMGIRGMIKDISEELDRINLSS